MILKLSPVLPGRIGPSLASNYDRMLTICRPWYSSKLTQAQRMVTEMVLAAGEAAMLMATGALHGKVIRGDRLKVRAKARRLRKR